MQNWRQDVLAELQQRKRGTAASKSKGTDQRAMRDANRSLVLNYIRERKTLPRSALARATGLSRTTIGTIVDELAEQGIIQQEASQDGEDRRTSRLFFNAAAGAVLGGTLGRKHVTLLLADLAGTPLYSQAWPLDTAEGPEKVLLALASLAKAFVSQYMAWEQLVGMGLGIVGPLDPSLRKTTVPTPFEGWAGVAIQEPLEHSLGIPVYLDNDGNMGALGESRYGLGQQERNMMYIKVGSGIAGGLIVDKRLYRGEQGMAGEIGHMPVDLHGTLCRCGQCGCLETIAGKNGILMEARRLNPEMTTMEQVIAAARAGDLACIHALERAGTYLGFALAGLVNCLNPALIVFDGSTMQAGEILMQPLAAALRAHCLPALSASTRLAITEQHGLSMARGGVATVLDQIFV